MSRLATQPAHASGELATGRVRMGKRRYGINVPRNTEANLRIVLGNGNRSEGHLRFPEEVAMNPTAQPAPR